MFQMSVRSSFFLLFPHSPCAVGSRPGKLLIYQPVLSEDIHKLTVKLKGQADTSTMLKGSIALSFSGLHLDVVNGGVANCHITAQCRLHTFMKKQDDKHLAESRKAAYSLKDVEHALQIPNPLASHPRKFCNNSYRCILFRLRIGVFAQNEHAVQI